MNVINYHGHVLYNKTIKSRQGFTLLPFYDLVSNKRLAWDIGRDFHWQRESWVSFQQLLTQVENLIYFQVFFSKQQPDCQSQSSYKRQMISFHNHPICADPFSLLWVVTDDLTECQYQKCYLILFLNCSWPLSHAVKCFWTKFTAVSYLKKLKWED